MFGVAHFLHTNDISVKLCEIAMDCANLAILFVARCVGPPAGKPLDVPKGRRDSGRRIDKGNRWGGSGSYLRAESAGKESDQQQWRKKSGGHNHTVTWSHR